MAKKKRMRRSRAEPSPARPRPRTLDAAIALALLNALWALFQWNELLGARAGEEAFCPLGRAGSCAALWDSPLASAVQHWTFIPVAAWGVVWSLVAIGLPLWTRRRRARGKPAASGWSATLLAACAGVVAVAVLAAASLAADVVCSTCVLTYLLTLAYGFTCLRDLEPPVAKRLARGVPAALGATLAAFLLLLYPGMRTPGTVRAADLGSIRPLELPPQRGPRDRLLASYLRGLGTAELQNLSDALAIYSRGAVTPLRPPRSLIGSAHAPVRITEFTDILCSHCADLHQTLALLLSSLPEGSFSLELRQFPLDSTCNPNASALVGRPIRCTAAKAIICVEQEQHAFDFVGTLFENARALSEERIYALAEPHVSRERLAACIASPATQAKLRDDIAWAMESGLRGTPHVLVNGRVGLAFPPFLYAILLSEGKAEHPLFASLPEARPW